MKDQVDGRESQRRRNENLQERKDCGRTDEESWRRGRGGREKKITFLWRIVKNIISKFVSLPIAGEVSTRKFKEDTMLQSYKLLNRRVKPGSAGKRHVYKPKQIRSKTDKMEDVRNNVNMQHP